MPYPKEHERRAKKGTDNSEYTAEMTNPQAVTMAVIYVDPSEPELIKTAATLLQQDIEQVTEKKILIVTEINQARKNVITIGTLPQPAFFKQLIDQKKINTTAINGQWEVSLVQTISNPAPGIAHALIVAGTDRRGAAYGVVELSNLN